MEIVILERATVGFDVGIDIISKYGNVTSYDTTPTELIVERIQDADIVIVNKSPLTAERLSKAKNVKLICEFATGYDNIDIDYCKSHGIRVCNVKGYSTDAVVQHTFALCLYLFEKLSYYDNYVKCGDYAKSSNFSHYAMNFSELSSKTWGIVGMGAIGSRVAKVADAFGCKVVRCDLGSSNGNRKSYEYESLSFGEFLSNSDIISLHCPLTDETRNLFNIDAFRKMKNDAILINVARGGVVNNADLYRALNENLIYGAGLDVLSEEPISPDNPLSNYTDSNRLIITPHMAWASNEARARVVQEAALNIEAFLNGEERNVIV